MIGLIDPIYTLLGTIYARDHAFHVHCLSLCHRLDYIAQIINPLADGNLAAFKDADKALRQAVYRALGISPYDQTAGACVDPALACDRANLCATRVLASRGMPTFASKPSLEELSSRFRASDSGRLRMAQFSLAWLSTKSRLWARETTSLSPKTGTSSLSTPDFPSPKRSRNAGSTCAPKLGPWLALS